MRDLRELLSIDQRDTRSRCKLEGDPRTPVPS
jgi:hypothetical protein